MMDEKRENSLALSVMQFLNDVQQQTENSVVRAKETSKILADIKKTAAANLLAKKKQIEDFESNSNADGRRVLSEKLRAMDKELEQRSREISELENEYQDLVAKQESLTEAAGEYERNAVDSEQTLANLRANTKKALQEKELEIEMIRTMTQVYFALDENCNAGVAVGYNAQTGRPDMTTLSFDENSTADEAQIVDKAWDAIASMVKRE